MILEEYYYPIPPTKTQKAIICLTDVCQSCLGVGNIAIPVFSICHHFPVLYEHEECPMCGGSGRRKQ